MVLEPKSARTIERARSITKRTVGELETQNAKLTESLAELTRAYDARNSRMLILERDLFDRTEERARLLKEKEEFAEEARMMASSAKQAQRARATSVREAELLKLKASDMSEEMQRLHREKLNLLDEISSERQRIERLEAVNVELRKTVGDLSADLQTERDAVTENAEKTTAFKKEIDRLSRHIRSLEWKVKRRFEELAVVTTMAEESDSAARAKEDELEREKTTLEGTRKELAVALDSLRDARLDSEEKRRLLDMKQVDLEEFRKVAEAALMDANEQRETLSIYKTEIGDLMLRLEKANLETDELRVRLTSVVQSRSWRWTKPLRKLSTTGSTER